MSTLRCIRRTQFEYRRAGSMRYFAGILVAFLAVVTVYAASAASVRLFALGRSTGEKPQSKIFRHDGSYWAVLTNQDGLGLYRRQGDLWSLQKDLGEGGKADVKLVDSTAYVLVFSSSPKLHVLDYQPVRNEWIERAEFPVSVPKIHASEALVLERDSTERLWYVAEGDEGIQVHYSTSADGATWSSEPIMLETGVNEDDIASIVAFGGDKVGVFWSDQNRNAFGFRVHHDGDPPELWDPTEVVFAGKGNADDHLNLASDTQGRVFAITKDAFNQLHVHRRGADESWTSVRNVAAGTANRAAIMVDEADESLWILYSNHSTSPASIAYQRASTNDLVFGEPIEFIVSTGDLDDVTGLKQPLPVGSLVAIATRSDQTAWSNAFDPPDPSSLTAQRISTGSGIGATNLSVVLQWDEPGLGPPDRYYVYRHGPGEPYQRIDTAPVQRNSFVDEEAPADLLCYKVTAVHDGVESSSTNELCVDLAPADPSARLHMRVQPNPFNPRTRITFHLTKSSQVRVDLHDTRGRRIATLANRQFTAGDRFVDWNGLDAGGRPVAAGVYVVSLKLGAHIETRKVTLLK